MGSATHSVTLQNVCLMATTVRLLQPAREPKTLTSGWGWEASKLQCDHSLRLQAVSTLDNHCQVGVEDTRLQPRGKGQHQYLTWVPGRRALPLSGLLRVVRALASSLSKTCCHGVSPLTTSTPEGKGLWTLLQGDRRAWEGREKGQS